MKYLELLRMASADASITRRRSASRLALNVLMVRCWACQSLGDSDVWLQQSPRHYTSSGTRTEAVGLPPHLVY